MDSMTKSKSDKLYIRIGYNDTLNQEISNHLKQLFHIVNQQNNKFKELAYINAKLKKLNQKDKDMMIKQTIQLYKIGENNHETKQN